MDLFFIKRKPAATFLLILALTAGFCQQEFGDNTVHAETSSEVNIFIEGTLDYNMANEIVTLVNAERKSAGLKPVIMSEDEVRSANIRARECILKYSHRRPVSAGWTALMSSGYSHVGENLAIGYNSAKSVVNAWMNSPEHRKNIMGSDYKSIGVSAFRYKHPLTGRETNVMVQHFSNLSGSKSEATGYKTDVFETTVDIDVYPLEFGLYPDDLDENEVVSLQKGDEIKPLVRIKADEIWGQDDVMARSGTLDWAVGNPKIAEITDEGNIKAIGIGTTTVEAIVLGGEFSSDFKIVVKKPISSVTINRPVPYEYTGDEVKPEMVLTDGEEVLTEGKDYKIVYSDNIYVGTANIHVIGMGEYGGECIIYFSIFDESTVIEESWFRKFLRFLGFD